MANFKTLQVKITIRTTFIFLDLLIGNVFLAR